ncbi:MAG TPA: DegQ family serine endoprotease [Candidatus Eisenbacteria bacterium]|nr:DegQ family serine endoprotease [Candidatus Eisenbacteria bacterium]
MTAAKKKVSYWLLIASVGALIVGGAFRLGLVRLPGHQVLGAEKVAVAVAATEPPVSLGDFKNGFASVLGPALPAVVNISSTKIVKSRNNMPDFYNDPFFRQFFGNQFPPSQGPQSEREYGLGSGVIVNADGYILTNNHVVDGASDVEVFTQDKKKYKAKILGTDPRTDIAVLKIDATGLPTLTLADSSKLKVGDIVFAIGQPFGIGETTTMGIVSATGRSLGGTIEHYEDFIQTDAAINPGNSGGALIDLRGNLVGINTAIISGGSGGNQGVGFAIPINMAHKVMDQIIEHGKVIRGYLGVSIQGVDPDIAKAFGLSHGGGALIGSVSPDSPASKGGMERGDIVLALNGQAINGPSDLSIQISQMAPGSVAHLKVFRNGQSKDLDVTLGEYPEKGAAASEEGGGTTPENLKGLQVQNLTPDIAQQLGLPASTFGVVVNAVDPSSAAAAAGIQQGDVIQEVNRKPVHNLEQYREALRGVGQQPALLLVNRGGTTHYVMVGGQ